MERPFADWVSVGALDWQKNKSPLEPDYGLLSPSQAVFQSLRNKSWPISPITCNNCHLGFVVALWVPLQPFEVYVFLVISGL